MKSRQTEDIVELKLPGTDSPARGTLRWDNGPATFTPDGQDTIELRGADSGGASSKPKRSWRTVRFTAGQPTVEADIIKAGEEHQRWFSPIFGDGWLVWETREGPGGLWARFETLDDVLAVRFEMVKMTQGRPAYAAKLNRNHTKMPLLDDPDELNWATYEARDGSVFTFRREGPPPPPGTFVEVRAGDYVHLSPKARKAYDAAKEAHEAEMWAVK